ncbi:MAG: hypothetical protein JWP12_2297 [Bacteroidetes bacterium]|nr:hypothetical protein [Bacteroidota bacterium]
MATFHKNVLKIILPVFILVAFYSCSNSFDGKNGLNTVHFPNSEKVMMTAEFKNGKRDGELKEYYKNGHLKTHQHYVNDKLDDSSLLYYENGVLGELQYFKDHKREGTWKKFNKEGKVISKVSYKNDRLDGPSASYTYRTLKLQKRLNYRNGLQEGKQELYYDNGKPQSVTYYAADKPCKGTEEWTETGEKINNDFKITVVEENKLLMENRLRYFITLENPQPGDEVCLVSEKDTGNVVTQIEFLREKDGRYLMEYGLAKGGFIMEKIRIGAFRRTGMGNTVIVTKDITVAANNY